jgi:hypothetical protein
MKSRSLVHSLPFFFAAASVALAISCQGRGSGTGQPYYGPGTGPIASFLPGGGGQGFAQKEFLYWVNSTTNDIAIYLIDSSTGSISPIGSNNISTGQRPISIQAHPDPRKRFMYVGCAQTGDILLYNIDSNGSGNLTPAATSINVANQGIFQQMKFRGDGLFLYVLTTFLIQGPGGQVQGTGVLTSFAVNQSTGALSLPQGGAGAQIQTSIQMEPATTSLQANCFCVDQNNMFAYVCMSDNKIVTVALANNGGLSLVQQTANGQNFINTAPSPTAILNYQTFLYEGSLVSSSLDFLQTASGQLSLNQNTFPSGGQQPVGLYIPITGGYVFSCNGQSGDISEFTIASGSGILGPQPLPPPLELGEWAQIINPMNPPQLTQAVTLRALAINSSGAFLYSMANGHPPMPLIPAGITCYTITGGLLNVATAGGGMGPNNQPFNFFQVQKGGQYGEQQLLCPDSIIVSHTN